MELVDGAPYLDEVAELIREYTEWLGRDLAFQGLDEELANLEGKYLPPHGQLVVAFEGDAVVGCVAYHRLDERTAEMKSLFVSPTARGHHLGEQLGQRIMELAREDGCTYMVLDTIEPLTAAIALYHKLGFEQIEPYYHNPMDDVLYFGREL